jgi:hypothetical protein
LFDQILNLHFLLEQGLESAIRSTQAMFAQNIDLLHNLTEKEINGLSVGIPTIQMTLNPGNEELVLYENPSLLFYFVRTYIARCLYVCEMFFQSIRCS